MKLSQWAKQQGIHYHTAWTWFKQGKLPVSAKQLPSGRIEVIEFTSTSNNNECVIDLCKKIIELMSYEK